MSVTVSEFQANNTSLYVDSDPGLGLWSTTDFHTWSAVPATQIDASASTVTQGNRVSVDDGVWTVTFTYAGSITPGSYAVANGSTSCVTACVTIAHFEHGNTGSCVATSGLFDIDYVSFQSGDLLSEAADFKIQCGLDMVAGSIRYGTAAGAVALDQDVDVIDFGEVLVGSTSQAYLTVTNLRIRTLSWATWPSPELAQPTTTHRQTRARARCSSLDRAAWSRSRLLLPRSVGGEPSYRSRMAPHVASERSHSRPQPLFRVRSTWSRLQISRSQVQLGSWSQ